MKKSIWLALLLPLLFFSCNTNSPTNNGDNNKVLGKSFKNYYVSDYSHGSFDEATTIVSFPHLRVCRVYAHWHTYWDDGEEERSSRNDYYGYSVKGNNVVFYDLDTEEELWTYVLSGDMLIDGSDVYLDNGTVELDSSLDNRIPPEGNRSYIPTGWYDSGYLEYLVDHEARFMYAAGDNWGLKNLPQEIENEIWNYGHASGLHIVDDHTIETAFQAVTLTRCDSYDTQTYGSYTYYFYFHSAFYSYSYRLIDGTIYLRDDDGIWATAGTYYESTGAIDIGAPNDELITIGNGFTKVNYNGGYRYNY